MARSARWWEDMDTRYRNGRSMPSFCAVQKRAQTRRTRQRCCQEWKHGQRKWRRACAVCRNGDSRVISYPAHVVPERVTLSDIKRTADKDTGAGRLRILVTLRVLDNVFFFFSQTSSQLPPPTSLLQLPVPLLLLFLSSTLRNSTSLVLPLLPPSARTQGPFVLSSEPSSFPRVRARGGRRGRTARGGGREVRTS
eukprot:2089220-Rhodomonas_salina.1